ncbi:helix-turn-helix transcriptional regulator [Deinococcus cellulosilyticus]|uniref:HTH arsR-type domain-containing protein n=1 Tax=Deinococcus cellulosilyticus (strain DSM 18568 / NBRC 106333 / KACC 11606 / 5516J-15) TaxID=1223518 RepID=A0A511N295_DEIC1|nr:helix-turn-helix transcriptional regulator [Deinococcus cellulosilyticus]GEM46972.1 hypothetical protein DC3_26070 [Deinococcus cellulosilyticus NBRC 106333 = KACC 11606]
MIDVSERRNCNVLLNSLNQRILGACMQREHTLKDLVESLHMDMSEAHYRVQQLIKAGILKVSREEKRAGRPIKYYAPTQEKFFLPFKDTVYSTVVDFMAEQIEPLMHRFLELAFRNVPQVGEWGLTFQLGEQDRKLSTVFGQQNPPSLDETSPREMMVKHRILGMWQNMELTVEDARSLTAELLDLYEKYRQKQNPGGEKHLMGLFLVPGDEHED